jgi:hypothetical protein
MNKVKEIWRTTKERAKTDQQRRIGKEQYDTKNYLNLIGCSSFCRAKDINDSQTSPQKPSAATTAMYSPIVYV